MFNDLVIPVGDVKRDTIPRTDTSLENPAKLPPTFDRTSRKGTPTAGNSSLLTAGAASVWVATDSGPERWPRNTPHVKLVDFEVAAIDFRTEGLLMAPAYAIARLLARNDLKYDDIGLREIHRSVLFPGAVSSESARQCRVRQRTKQAFAAVWAHSRASA